MSLTGYVDVFHNEKSATENYVKNDGTYDWTLMYKTENVFPIIVRFILKILLKIGVMLVCC